MVAAFGQVAKIPGITLGEGAVVCLADRPLPLVDGVWMLPAHFI
jgi:hypothetical protein